jgi:hypothetical protein
MTVLPGTVITSTAMGYDASSMEGRPGTLRRVCRTLFHARAPRIAPALPPPRPWAMAIPVGGSASESTILFSPRLEEGRLLPSYSPRSACVDRQKVPRRARARTRPSAAEVSGAPLLPPAPMLSGGAENHELCGRERSDENPSAIILVLSPIRQ